MTPEESGEPDKKTLSHIEEEIGDIMIYLTTLAAAYNIDPIVAARKKIITNKLKYPEPPQ